MQVLIVVYAVICLGAIGISFISLLDQKAVNNLAVRIVTIVILSVSWYEPLTFVSGIIAKSGGPPQWLMIAIPMVLMVPFFYTSVTIFTGPTGIAEKIQNTITMRMNPIAESFPAAEKAEAAKDWDGAFALYRDKYLPKQYNNPLIWQRIAGILRQWKDPEKSFNELLTMVKQAPDEEARIVYALSSADALLLGIGSSGRCVKLLKAVLPAISKEEFKALIVSKLASVETTLRQGVTTRTAAPVQQKVSRPWIDDAAPSPSTPRPVTPRPEPPAAPPPPAA